ncbi:MAG TPA: TRAP transporter small permease [Rhizobiaceae bacterium]|nr:TRAP transporter small permease [Rhizobiaceae bacterium]
MKALGGVLQRGFLAIESASLFVAAFAMLLIMLVASADVLMRYMFNAPFTWTHELIRLYLVPAIVYLAVSAAFAANAHIAVDIIQYYISDRARQWTYLVTDALGAVLFAAIAWVAAERAYDEYVSGDVLSGIILWHVWPSSAIVAFGSLLLGLRAAGQAFLRATSLGTGVEQIGLPPLAVEEDFETEAR